MEQINRFSIKPNGNAEKISTSVIICSATSLFRMKKFGPKCLFLYKDDRLINHQTDTIKSINHNIDIIVTVGHMAGRITKANKKDVRFVKSDNYDTAGMSEEIRVALEQTASDTVIIADGDVWFNHNAFKTVFYSKKSGLLEDTSNMPDEEPGMIVENGIVSNLAYDLYPKWGQICVMSGNELTLAREILSTNKYSYFLFHELINEIINRGGKFDAIRNKEAKTNKINNPKVLKHARSYQEIKKPVD